MYSSPRRVQDVDDESTDELGMYIVVSEWHL